MSIKKKEEYDEKKSMFYEYLINGKNFQFCFDKISISSTLSFQNHK
jgi:hypothetical protein